MGKYYASHDVVRKHGDPDFVVVLPVSKVRKRAEKFLKEGPL